MGPTTFLGLFFVLFTIGILLKDIDKLNNYDLKKKIFIKIGLSFIFTFLLWLFTLIDRYTENNYTLKKFIDYYGLRYGDRLDFNYHIKSDHAPDKKEKPIKTPICKIDGNIDKSSLTINNITDCDADEDIVEKYKKIFSTTLDLKDNSGKEIEDSKLIESQISFFIDD
jgi:hypothetical protein